MRKKLWGATVAFAVTMGAAYLGLQAASGQEGLTLREQSEAAEEQMRQEGLKNPAPKPDDPYALAPAPEPEAWPEGIFDDGEYPSPYYSFVNRWQEEVDGQNVVVYAGSIASASSEGVLLLWVQSRETYEVKTKEVSVALPGPLEIVGADGLNLTIGSANADATVIFTVKNPGGVFGSSVIAD